MNPIFYIKLAFNAIKRWFASAQAKPYLDSAEFYVEEKLNSVVGAGNFDIELDSGSGIVYYKFEFGGTKYTIALSVGSNPVSKAVVMARDAAPTRDVEINLGEMIKLSPGNMLPTHLIDAKLSALRTDGLDF